MYFQQSKKQKILHLSGYKYCKNTGVIPTEKNRFTGRRKSIKSHNYKKKWWFRQAFPVFCHTKAKWIVFVSCHNKTPQAAKL